MGPSQSFLYERTVSRFTSSRFVMRKLRRKKSKENREIMLNQIGMGISERVILSPFGL